ncbi:class I SAM-dependent methyltransferase [Desulfallas thermosapovorans]|uniref:Putative SAM-dependent methyltransferase n=1 Tax=Desulfallas thermosapovorans DSM 6562 TaxID=1121431 RepID=A0A5S4ZXL8_9FIRM|nr:class I SAM-dependent methyltransferase [Desulfallas thermosapovorans]TYO97803.1 putative SAM-dependent methyltransferase [Desulfallas thermosapovorans DSM 6562]
MIAQNGRCGIVTTSLKPRAKQWDRAEIISAETGFPLVPRGKKTIQELAEEWHAEHVIVVKDQQITCITGDSELFFHPSMAILRIKEIRSGKNDTMINAMGLKPGEKLLDCTLGLGVDAVVASFVLGKEGLVVGLESSPIIASIVRAGLHSYKRAAKAIQEAMERIVVVNADHRTILDTMPPNSFDVVYFDPMFRRPVLKSSAINALRPLADTRLLIPEVIDAALRVARRRVVVKDNKEAHELIRLGFSRIEGGKHSQVKYGIMIKKE